MTSMNTRDYTEYFENLFAALYLIFGSLHSWNDNIYPVFEFLKGLGFAKRLLNFMMPNQTKLAENPYIFEED